MTELSEQPGKIIPPEMANFLAADDFNVRLDKLLLATQENTQAQLKNQEISIQTQKIQKQILKELRASADDGEVIRLNGTVTTTEFTIVNTITDPGHPIKAFTCTNDGNNSIYVGFNVVLSGEGADIIDVTNELGRFDEIAPGEDLIYRYNRHKIRNIYLLAKTDTSTYRLKLIW